MPHDMNTANLSNILSRHIVYMYKQTYLFMVIPVLLH